MLKDPDAGRPCALPRGRSCAFFNVTNEFVVPYTIGLVRGSKGPWYGSLHLRNVRGRLSGLFRFMDVILVSMRFRFTSFKIPRIQG